MKRLIWLPVAGFLLVAGAAVAAASPGVLDKAAAVVSLAQDDGSDTGAAEPSTSTGGLRLHVERDGLLDEVLADLVTSGVITQDQSDAITDALTARVDERQAEAEAQRQKMEEMWTQIQGFLEDGVITADEIAQLPADNPFSNISSILEDGQVTLEELQSVGHFGLGGPGGAVFGGPGLGGPGFGGRHHGGPGFGPGRGTWLPSDGTTDPNQQPAASPEATSPGS
jgi:polyhydroxyalkanoate synthesis regulator phasin